MKTLNQAFLLLKIIIYTPIFWPLYLGLILGGILISPLLVLSAKNWDDFKDDLYRFYYYETLRHYLNDIKELINGEDYEEEAVVIVNKDLSDYELAEKPVEQKESIEEKLDVIIALLDQQNDELGKIRFYVGLGK